MKVQEIALARLREAPWNPNVMSAETRAKLRQSVERFGIVENLVARPMVDAFGLLSATSGSSSTASSA